jgi:purine-binding chemotaxis protein CheW
MNEPAASSATAHAQFGPVVAAGARLGSAAGVPTQLISFAIGDDQYGVDIMAVREIKGWTEITHLPKQPDYVRGVVNLRGSSFRSSICAAGSVKALRKPRRCTSSSSCR